MTLDVYADLFEDDLNTVAVALDRARWRAREDQLKLPHQPFPQQHW